MRQGQELAVARHLRSLNRTLSDSAAMPMMQLGRLNRMLAIASTTEPYRSLWGGPVGPLGDMRELETLPLVTRAHLYSTPLKDRTAPGQIPVHLSATSGTSGLVLESAISADEGAFISALAIREWRLRGWTRRIPHLLFRLGPNRSIGFRQTGLGAQIGVDVPVADQVAALERVRPGYVVSPPTTLLELADRVGRYPLQGLATFGEVLDPDARSELRSAFATDPLDEYGTTEVGIIAWQCPDEGSYHMNADAVVIEILDDEGRPVPRGVVGEVVVTSLWNVTNPIVRYRTGDAASLADEACPCGVPLPMMSQVEGRRNDWILRHDGDRISPWRIFEIIARPEARDLMKGYRFVQRTLEDCLMEVVWRREPRPDVLDGLEEPLERLLGGAVSLEIRTVDALAIRPGSRRLIESRVGDARLDHSTSGARGRASRG